MNYHGRMMSIPCVIPLLPDREYTYVGGHKDARHAAAEIANEADTQIAALEAENVKLAKEFEFRITAEHNLREEENAAHFAEMEELEAENAELKAAATENGRILLHIELAAKRARITELEAENKALRELAEKLWTKVNEWRCRLIQWKAAGDVSPRDLAELAELQALADEHLRVIAPLPIAELEQYMREHGIEVPAVALQEGPVKKAEECANGC